MPELIKSGARTLDDLYVLVDKESEHPYLLDRVKQLGFYTDYLGDARLSIPVEIADESLARRIVTTADVLVNARTSAYTTKEVDLWIENLGPAWGQDMPSIKEGIVRFYEAMQAHGLEPAGPNEMELFVT